MHRIAPVVLLLLALPLGCPSVPETTWRYDTLPVDTTPDDTGEVDTEDGEYEKVIWGETEDGEALTGFWLYDPSDGGVLCDMDYEVEDIRPSEDCDSCEQAFVITRGEYEIWDNEDGACDDEGWTVLEGTSFGVGHEGEEIWADFGEGWELVDGEGEVWEQGFWFEIWLE